MYADSLTETQGRNLPTTSKSRENPDTVVSRKEIVMTAKRGIIFFLAPALVMVMAFALYGCGKSQSKPETIFLSPDIGPVGIEVVITGGSFGATQGTGTVHFGNSLAEVLDWSDVSISVQVPSGLSVAEYGVTVQTQAGSSKEVTFTVNQAPKPSIEPIITSLEPTSGQSGTEVVISGENFGKTQAGGLILFGPGKATVTAWSDTSITFKVPAEASNNVYGVKVETTAGKSGQVNFKVARPEDLAAQKNAIISNMGSHGIDIQGSDQWTVDFLKQSMEDPNWEVLRVNEPNGKSFQALLILNQMLGDWECLSTEGPPWNGVDFKGASVPSDLKNI